MENRKTLPENYRQVAELNLGRTSRRLIMVNAVRAALFLFLILLGFAFAKESTLRSVLELSFFPYFCWMLLLAGMIAVYIVTRQYMHRFLFRAISGGDGEIIPTVPYITVGSSAYYNRGSYLMIVLIPVIVWEFLTLFAILLFPPVLRVLFWILQCINAASTVRYAYTVYILLRLPANILIRDTGAVMSVYTDEENPYPV